MALALFRLGLALLASWLLGVILVRGFLGHTRDVLTGAIS